MPDKTTIELKDIRKTYIMGETQIHALRGIDLTIKEGEMVAVMGASGSGKSTFLNIVGCLDKPTRGTYTLDGENVSALDKDQLAVIRNKKLGFVFQGFNLLGRATVEANVELPMIYAGMDKKEMAARAKDALLWVGLSQYLHHYPNQMSGGQQQRVAIARALVNNPSLILADEPTGALDSRTSIEIVAVMQRLNQEKGITVVIVTHDQEVAFYCKRLVKIKDGHIIEDAPVLNPRNAAEDLAALPVEAEALL